MFLLGINLKYVLYLQYMQNIILPCMLTFNYMVIYTYRNFQILMIHAAPCTQWSMWMMCFVCFQCRPDDSHTATAATPKLQYFVSKGQHNPPPIDLDLEALEFLDDYTEYTDLLRDLEHGETENTFVHDADFGYQSNGSTVSTDFGYQNIGSTSSTDFGCQSTGSTASINTLGDVHSNNSISVPSVTDYSNADIDPFTNHLHCYSFDHPSSIPQSVDPVL